MAERGEAAARSLRNVKLRREVKPEVLRKVQDSIHFEKTITASSASGYVGHACRLALPKEFVRQHGEKIRKSVILVSTKAWPVTIDICFQFSQVKFSGGWRAFADFHGLLEGDSLIFLLTAMSRFKVYVFGRPEGIPAEVQRNRSSGSEVLLRKAGKQSRERTDKHFAAEDAIDMKSRGLKPESSFKEIASSRKATKPLCTDDKAEALRKLQGSVHFEKKVTASSASDYLGRDPRLPLPSEFVRCHGDKFRRSVILRVLSSTKEWPVRLAISFPLPKTIHVKLGGGWRAFADFNDLVEGDSLIFTLTAISEFEVYVFSSTGNPKKLPSSQPVPKKETSIDSESPRKKAKQCKSEPVSIAEGLEGAVKLEEAIAHRPASLRNASSSKDIKSKNVKDGTSEDRHNDSSKTKQEPALDSFTEPVGRKNPRNEHQASPFQKNFHLPGFCKKLTARNVCNGKKVAEMELPLEFWKAYRRRLGAVVKLQGIHEESEARPVSCCPSYGRQTRVFLRSGWKEFATENDLEVGQELKYTLTADSYFVVREVQLPPP